MDSYSSKSSERMSLPINDSEVERHKFYVAITKEIDFTNIKRQSFEDITHDSIKRIYERYDKVKREVEETANELSEIKIKSKTVLSGITVMWILFGSIFGWVWEKTTSKASGVISQVVELESKIKELENQNNSLNSELLQLKAVKQQFLTVQQDVDSLLEERRKREQQ